MIGRQRRNPFLEEVPEAWRQPNWVGRGNLPITPGLPQGGGGDLMPMDMGGSGEGGYGPPPGIPAWMSRMSGRGSGISIPMGSLGGFGGTGYGPPTMAGLPNQQSDVGGLDDWYEEYMKQLQQQGGGGNFGLA